jgi:hypothetical protein
MARFHGRSASSGRGFSEPPRQSIPKGRGRQHIAARLVQLTGTRPGGFVLTREKAAGKWGTGTYSLVRT